MSEYSVRAYTKDVTNPFAVVLIPLYRRKIIRPKDTPDPRFGAHVLCQRFAEIKGFLSSERQGCVTSQPTGARGDDVRKSCASKRVFLVRFFSN